MFMCVCLCMYAHMDAFDYANIKVFSAYIYVYKSVLKLTWLLSICANERVNEKNVQGMNES